MHRNYQMDQLAEQIADLNDQMGDIKVKMVDKDQMADQIADLNEQMGDIKVKIVNKDQMSEQIGDLKDHMANHTMELKELIERHMEGN